MIPKLVFAIDTNKVDQAINLAKKAIIGGADIIEAGTPLIKIGGVNIVYLLRKKYPSTPIYADLKVIDFPELEIIDYFSAGASIVSLMAFTNNQNIIKALNLTKSYNKKIWVSTMGYYNTELIKRVEELKRIGVDNIIAHGSGEQDCAFDDLIKKTKLISQVNGIKLIVGGGITKSNIDKILRYKPRVVIVGRGISMDKDIKTSTLSIKKRILRYTNQERS